MNVFEMSGDGRVVRGVPTSDNLEGLFIGPNGLQGWEGLPARRREALARPLANGEYDVPVRLPARVITIDPGVILGSSRKDLKRLIDSVNGWGGGGRRFALTASDDDEPRTSYVRVISAEGVDLRRQAGGIHHGSMRVQFIAADPRQYATMPRRTLAPAGAAVMVESRGNFPLHPIIEIPDAPTSYTISSPAGTFTVTGATGGGLHQIFLRNGRVHRDGAWIKNIGRGDLWTIADGTEMPITLSVAGRVLAYDTWI
ncbi:hypothetical protein QE430_002472 [Microbacterium testaceum]|uniref:hypothetical protein n=1 Tax=Microbacterium testaceum TaxID=2033 RepID=UPI0027865B87|nr:hypothetical protein [Microbacterium testaceum]MDQ1174165.1 hypothetical protein [Microbacterium testaceum]